MEGRLRRKADGEQYLITVDGESFFWEGAEIGVVANCSACSEGVTLAGFWVGQANLMQVRLCGAGSAGLETVTSTCGG